MRKKWEYSYNPMMEDYLMKYIKKIVLGIKSVLVTFIYKLMYRNLLCIGWLNSIRGKLHIEIFASGNNNRKIPYVARAVIFEMYRECTTNYR